MINTSPFISVLIPSFNRPEYLKKTLKSVFETINIDFEVIVADDFSPKINEILSIIKEFEFRENFKFYSHKKNIGWSENWNYLVQKANGIYVIILGDDDCLFPISLERIKINIEKNRNADLFVIGYQVIDSFGNYTYSIRSTKSIIIDLTKHRLVKKLFNADVLPFALFHPFTLAYKRELHNEVKYNKEAGIGSDYLFLFDAILAGKIILIIPEVLFSWRKTFSSGSGAHQNLSSIERNIEARQKILTILRGRLIIPEYLKKHIDNPRYYNRFILNPYISHKELWHKKIKIFPLADTEDYKKLKFKLNLLYYTYLRVIRMFEKLIFLGFYPTFLNIYSYFRRK